jgi:hypothetical protein
MAMETALLGCALPLVVDQILELFSRTGYLVSLENNLQPVIIARHKGNRFKLPREAMLPLSELNEAATRIDITASIHGK